MLIYVDLPMKSGILEAQQRIVQADSDYRLSINHRIASTRLLTDSNGFALC